MTKWVGVLGTWAFPGAGKREWFQDGSTFAESLKYRGFEVARPGEEFVWSGDLDGTWLPGAKGNDWEAGASNLAYYLRHLPFHERNVIAHSHGGSVALAAATHVPIRALVTIGTPARREARENGKVALESGFIQAWAHVSDAKWDTWGQLGALFDGQWRLSRKMDIPGCRDVRLKGIGHSKLLDGLHSDVWEREGLFTLLREAK